MKQKSILFFLAIFLFPALLMAQADDFRIYKKPLVEGVEIAQTDTHTELLYKGKVIKRFVNTEFAIELLPHGPDEDPDCYNSLAREVPSDRAKNIIGKDYLRACLVLQTKILRSRFVLFYGPALDGNRVSLYDIRTKKFTYAAANNVLDVRTILGGGILFTVKQVGDLCQKKVMLYKDGLTRKIFDECSLKTEGIPLIRIDSIRALPKKIIIRYTPYTVNASGEYLLETKKKSTQILPL